MDGGDDDLIDAGIKVLFMYNREDEQKRFETDHSFHLLGRTSEYMKNEYRLVVSQTGEGGGTKRSLS